MILGGGYELSEWVKRHGGREHSASGGEAFSGGLAGAKQTKTDGSRGTSVRARDLLDPIAFQVKLLQK